MGKGLSRAAGVLLSLVTLLMALMLTGAGHGWYGGVLFSLPLLFLYPIALGRAFDSEPGSREADISILIAAIILDVLLLGNTLSDEYFGRMWDYDPTFVSIWIALWAGWQPFIVVSLLRKRIAAVPPGERVIDLL